MNSYNQSEDNTGMYIFIGMIILVFAVGGVTWMFGGPIIASIKGMFSISNMLGLGKVFDALDTTCTETDKGSKDINKKCTKNCECKNGVCGRKTAADGAPTVCCETGKVGTFGGYDYCLGMPDGSTCWSDAQCASDYCKGNLSGLQRGKCKSLLPTGASCTKDYQCESDGCGRNGGEDSRLECCPGANFISPNSKDYCKGTLNTGQVCASDKQCKNGNCKGNTWGDGICN